MPFKKFAKGSSNIVRFIIKIIINVTIELRLPKGKRIHFGHDNGRNLNCF